MVTALLWWCWGQMGGQTIAGCCTIAAPGVQPPLTRTTLQQFGLNPNCANPFLSPGQHSALTPLYSAVLYIIDIMSPGHDTQWKVHLATLIRSDNISTHMSAAGYI